MTPTIIPASTPVDNDPLCSSSAGGGVEDGVVVAVPVLVVEVAVPSVLVVGVALVVLEADVVDEVVEEEPSAASMNSPSVTLMGVSEVSHASRIVRYTVLRLLWDSWPIQAAAVVMKSPPFRQKHAFVWATVFDSHLELSAASYRQSRAGAG
jgi:hypothetical protein